jgi:hypothetical protein
MDLALVQEQVPVTLLWDNINVHMVQQTRVPTMATLDQMLAAQPNVKMVGPFNYNDAHTKLVCTRRSMLIPTKYVPMMILDGGLLPKDVWL